MFKINRSDKKDHLPFASHEVQAYYFPRILLNTILEKDVVFPEQERYPMYINLMYS